MNKTTIRLTAKLWQQIKADAKRQNMSAAALVRQHLAAIYPEDLLIQGKVIPAILLKRILFFRDRLAKISAIKTVRAFFTPPLDLLTSKQIVDSLWDKTP